MDTRKIGSLDVTVVGLGCNNFGTKLEQDDSTAVIHAALDAGITFFDTADIYGFGKSETFMGNALRGRRDEAVIATKFGMGFEGHAGGGSAAYVKWAAEQSLSRLQTDHIDLLQIHRPDPETPIAETLGAFGALVAEGKVREIGCSNFSVDQLREAKAAVAPGQPGFASVQNNYSLLMRDAKLDVIPECEKVGIGFLPFFPLFNGMLTGKYRRGQELPKGTRLGDSAEENQQRVFTEENFAVVENLIEYAESRGHSILDVAIARLIAEPSIPSVIAGATKPAQVVTNAAAGEWRLTAEEIAAIDAIVNVA